MGDLEVTQRKGQTTSPDTAFNNTQSSSGKSDFQNGLNSDSSSTGVTASNVGVQSQPEQDPAPVQQDNALSTSQNPTPSSEPEKKDSGSSGLSSSQKAAIGGGVAGGVAFLGIAGFVVYRRRQHSSNTATAMSKI